MLLTRLVLVVVVIGSLMVASPRAAGAFQLLLGY
jgi:hypothetical protein